MTRLRILTAAAATAGILGVVASAQAVTGPQARAKCKAAWSGPASGAAYNAYQARCTAAAIAATDAATDAGNPTSAGANRSRAVRECGRRYPAPRNTAAKTKAYQACVRAAIASQVAFAGRPLRATLSYANEVPPGGLATGTASIRLNQGRKRVCYRLTLSGQAGSPVAGAHIHRGVAGVNGGVVVALTNIAALDSGAAATGCEQNVDANLIKEIRQNPAGFYVNIHTQAFPGGAARGQLSR